MAYHEEDRVSRLIVNYVMWAGDVPVRSCADLFDEDKINLRELRQEWRNTYRFEALGSEAQITKDTLDRMDKQLRFAVWTFHTSSLTFEMQAKSIVGVSKSTYHRRLVEGHITFMEVYDEQLQSSRERTASYARALSASQIMGNTK
jgi:hypothetical protein